MPLRLFLLPLLAPAIAALVLFLLLGWRLDALFVALATLSGSLLTLLAARGALKRQLLTLARQVRTRAEALACMRRALREFAVEGVKTTIPLHREIFNHFAFIEGSVDTTFIERTWQKN